MNDDDLHPGEPESNARAFVREILAQGGSISTELTHIHDRQVVIRAMVTLSSGASATAHASEPLDASGLLDQAIEIAEERALLRVAELVTPLEAAAVRPEPLDSPPGQIVRPASPGEDPPVVPGVAPPEPDLADYSWTHLWSWARKHGVTNRRQVEELIGRPAEGLDPREIRALLKQAGLSD